MNRFRNYHPTKVSREVLALLQTKHVHSLSDKTAQETCCRLLPQKWRSIACGAGWVDESSLSVAVQARRATVVIKTEGVMLGTRPDDVQAISNSIEVWTKLEIVYQLKCYTNDGPHTQHCPMGWIEYHKGLSKFLNSLTAFLRVSALISECLLYLLSKSPTSTWRSASAA